MRLIDHMEAATADILSRLEELQLQGYEEQDIGSAARDSAALWERSLKACRPDWAASSVSLYDMTKVLRNEGWPQASALHTLRKAANSDKHDSAPSHDLAAIVGALEDLATGTRALEDC